MSYKSIFGGSGPAAKPVPDTNWYEHVVQLVREKEPEVLAQADEYLAKVVAEHAEDTKAYQFGCQRWGDFLSVQMQRLGRRHEIASGVQGRLPERYASAINLKATQEIRLVEGTPADADGVVYYWAGLRKTDDSGYSMGMARGGYGARYTYEQPPDGWYYRVDADMPYEFPRHMIHVHVHVASTGGTGGSGGNCTIVTIPYDGGAGAPYDRSNGLPTTRFPRYAVDDKIVFAGIATTLFVPYGRGKEVYDTIMQEIRKGTEPYALP